MIVTDAKKEIERILEMWAEHKDSSPHIMGMCQGLETALFYIRRQHLDEKWLRDKHKNENPLDEFFPPESKQGCCKINIDSNDQINGRCCK